MHLLVLGAFWHDQHGPYRRHPSRVLMHLLVLGALWPVHLPGTGRGPGVLMHLVVLGAFWPGSDGHLDGRGGAVLMHLVVLGAF